MGDIMEEKVEKGYSRGLSKSSYVGTQKGKNSEFKEVVRCISDLYMADVKVKVNRLYINIYKEFEKFGRKINGQISLI